VKDQSETETLKAMQNKSQRQAALLRRCVEKIRILLDQTGHVYSGGENAGWLIDAIHKEIGESS